MQCQDVARNGAEEKADRTQQCLLASVMTAREQPSLRSLLQAFTRPVGPERTACTATRRMPAA